MSVEVEFAGARFVATGEGALWWPQRRALLVADLHLGKSARMARRGGPLLPPFEGLATLARLARIVERLEPAAIWSLGDAFDDAQAETELAPAERAALEALGRGRDWLWIAGNHEGLTGAGFGETVADLALPGLTLRHIAADGPDISGHYHPKARLAGVSRAAFLIGAAHLVLPAFGTYTGGLDWRSPELRALVGDGIGVLTGPRALRFPLR